MGTESLRAQLSHGVVEVTHTVGLVSVLADAALRTKEDNLSSLPPIEACRGLALDPDGFFAASEVQVVRDQLPVSDSAGSVPVDPVSPLVAPTDLTHEAGWTVCLNAGDHGQDGEDNEQNTGLLHLYGHNQFVYIKKDIHTRFIIA
jgi:hypothetical protein